MLVQRFSPRRDPQSDRCIESVCSQAARLMLGFMVHTSQTTTFEWLQWGFSSIGFMLVFSPKYPGTKPVYHPSFFKFLIQPRHWEAPPHKKTLAQELYEQILLFNAVYDSWEKLGIFRRWFGMVHEKFVNSWCTFDAFLRNTVILLLLVLQKLEKHTQNIRNQFYYVEIHEFTDIADLGQHLLTLITYLTPGTILASTTTKWAPTVGFVGFVSPATGVINFHYKSSNSLLQLRTNINLS